MGQGLPDRLPGERGAGEQPDGLKMSDLLELAEPVSGLLHWMLRQGPVTGADVAAFLGQDEAGARTLLAELRDRGFVREIELREVTHYRVRLAPKRGRALSSQLWPALDEPVEPGEEA